MTAPLCRCGREKRRHDGDSPVCTNYQPMDFKPYLDAITNCNCDLCNALGYAVSLPQSNWVPRSNALLDALEAGTHTYRSRAEWIQKLHANSSGGRGF